MSVLATLAQTSVNYSYDGGASTAVGAGGILAFFMAFLALFLVLGLGLYIFGAIVLGKMFKKANRPVWPAWVPVYNIWKLLEISGYPGWLVLVPIVVSIIPVINILSGLVSLAFAIFIAIAAGRAYGKRDAGWIILLTILPIVGYAILAFGDAKYKKPTEKDLLFKV